MIHLAGGIEVLHRVCAWEVLVVANEGITLECGECKQRNYRTTKNKKTVTNRLELRKYCKFCGKHTPHKETR